MNKRLGHEKKNILLKMRTLNLKICWFLVIARKGLKKKRKMTKAKLGIWTGKDFVR